MCKQLMPFIISLSKARSLSSDMSTSFYTKSGQAIFNMTDKIVSRDRDHVEFSNSLYCELISVQTLEDAENFTQQHPDFRYAFHGQPHIQLNEFEAIDSYHKEMKEDVMFFQDIRAFIDCQKEYYLYISEQQKDKGEKTELQTAWKSHRKHLLALYRKHYNRLHVNALHQPFPDEDAIYGSEFFNLLPLIDKLKTVVQYELLSTDDQISLFTQLAPPEKFFQAKAVLDKYDLDAYVKIQKNNKPSSVLEDEINDGERLQEQIISADTEEDQFQVIESYFENKEALLSRYKRLVRAQTDRIIDSLMMRDVEEFLRQISAEANISYDPVNSCINYHCKDLRTAMYMMANVSAFNEDEYRMCSHPKCHTYYKVDKSHPQSRCDRHMKARQTKRANARKRERGE